MSSILDISKSLPSLPNVSGADRLSTSMLPALVLLSLLFVILTKGLYNVYFHPLSKIPGPFLSAFTELVYLWYWVRGDLVKHLCSLHQKYGKTVRIGPNRLSFIDAEVWKDIYGYKVGGNKKAAIMKDPQMYGPESNGRFSILAKFDDTEHKALRKVFQPGFSDRALRAQEPMIRGHVDKLVRNIYELINHDKDIPLNFVRMFNCITFDIIGELAFGESMGLLDDGKMYGWVESIDGALFLGPYLSLFPWLMKLAMLILPGRLLESQAENIRYASNAVDKRLAKGKVTEKPDFWSLVLNSKDSEVLDHEDMKANANLFMAAGSETTATSLSGLMYNLLSHPDKLEKLLKEIRSSFSSEADHTIENIQKLKYLAACFDESMRLYPATPLSIPRLVVNGGGEVNGQFVPDQVVKTPPINPKTALTSLKTRVAISTFAAYHSPHNFKDPEDFVPERWLPSDPLYAKYADDRRDVFQPFSYGPRNCIGKK
ncbi:Cytochrome P450 [Macrophomina phaseolina MS6]|uniref:Cytochrome P450 n=1 Tax=Macrophomina phaseolina (strain MS6) TaxID=1126212 RepID=K2SFW0_MACPH|nr:Cytochrome P450 [Macrophomina phaseolina MS6]